MKKLLTITALAAALTSQGAIAQSVGINFGVGTMYSTTNTTTTMPTGALINVLALTNGATWASLGSLNTLFSNLTNSFLPANTARVGFFGNDNSGGPGYANGSILFNLSGGVATGQELLLVVYSGLTTNSSSPGLGQNGFFYRDSSYVIPSPGTIDIFSETANIGGPIPANQFTSGTGAVGGSGFTTVPEPSTYALLAMSGLALGGYILRRRSRA
jgi:hypothetical protein